MTQANKAEAFRTTCCYCGVGCGILVEKRRDGRLSLKGDEAHPVNRGKLCSKGLNLLYTALDRSDRLLWPELRLSRQEARQRVTWDIAMEKAASVFRETIARHGPDSVGFYVSGQCLTEEYYLANKLVKGFLRTNSIDTNSRLCMSTAVTAYRLALGEDAVPCSYEDLDQADLFFVTGANPAFCHPILFRRMEERLQSPGVRLVVVDPRRTQSAEMAHLHLAIWPGTDITLYHAIARWLLENNGIDEGFIRAHTEGFEELRSRVMSRTLAEAAAVCRISVEDLCTAARWIAESNGFLSLWAMGLNQSTIGVAKNLALINLHLLTGKIGKPGHGPFSLTGQPNAMGGREVGGLATMLSAHRDLQNPQHRAEIARYWGVSDVPDKPGVTAGEMADALLSGKLKALWIVCTNPLVSWPDLNKTERALRAAEFVVVEEISQKADTLRFADLVLPAATWLEKEGTMTNSERRIGHLAKAMDPPGEALPDGEILVRFAQKMGFKQAFPAHDPATHFREHAGLTTGTNLDISGLDYDRLKAKGSVCWPCPDSDHPGTERLFADHQFYRPGGRAKLFGVDDQNISPPPDADFPLVLTTGRIRDQWHTMTRTGKVRRLGRHEPEAVLDIHPADADRRGIKNGQLVTVQGRVGHCILRARITDSIKQGVVFLPMHWGKIGNRNDVRANNLTESRWDPKSKEPDLKWSTVEVRPSILPRKKIVIIGAGAAALAFVREYRKDNIQDEIEVFSREPLPFYNRVRLPEIVESPQPWETLSLLSEEERSLLAIKVHARRSIESIDRKHRRVCDADGTWHDYDTLVLATGSRGVAPPDAPYQLAGVHTLRTYEDAQRIIASAEAGRAFVIVGGGLIGLEVAGALRQRGIAVHIVQRSAHLMSKQLDLVAGEILRDEMLDRGVQFHFSDHVTACHGVGRVQEIHLHSGTRIEDADLVYAMGTVPNTDLAASAGLSVRKGVVVDATMQTSDPHILAVGEVAEFAGQLHGITAACEEQARAAARYLAGDVQAVYTGSMAQTLLKVAGLNLVSLGMVHPPEGEAGYEEIVFLHRQARVYKKCILQGDRLMGAILVGEKSEYREFRDLIQSGEELGDRRFRLLRSGGNNSSPAGRIICSCLSVGEETLKATCAQGNLTVADLMARTGAGTGCGSCRPELAGMLKKAALPKAS